jgi:hypothetical protein
VLAVRIKRDDSRSATGVIITASVFVAMLASHVFEAFDVTSEAVDTLGRKIAVGPQGQRPARFVTKP